MLSLTPTVHVCFIKWSAYVCTMLQGDVHHVIASGTLIIDIDIRLLFTVTAQVKKDTFDVDLNSLSE